MPHHINDEKKRMSTNKSKQGGRCDDVIVNELLDAQAATIGAWKLDNVIDQMSESRNTKTNSSRGMSSQILNATEGTLDLYGIDFKNIKKNYFYPCLSQKNYCTVLYTRCSPVIQLFSFINNVIVKSTDTQIRHEILRLL